MKKTLGDGSSILLGFSSPAGGARSQRAGGAENGRYVLNRAFVPYTHAERVRPEVGTVGVESLTP